MTPLEDTHEIIAEVAEESNVPSHIILGSDRSAGAVRARKKAIRRVYARKPYLSSTQLGRIFNMHHTSILYHLGRLRG